MKLTAEQIRDAARGVTRVELSDGLIGFYRFTKEQQLRYRDRNADHYMKTFATAGVILEFDTDSENLRLNTEVSKGSSRPWFVHSIFVDGVRIGQLSGRLGEGNAPVTVEGSFTLGAGRKRVKIQFPWSACSRIRTLSLDDGASFAPVRKEKKLLIFGDSITQGYDAKAPENAYACRIAEYLDADGINKAIGGEVFWPELAQLRDDIQPEVITVAYGTNDWSGKAWEALAQNSREFYHNLRKTYPEAQIIALAPIWRADWQAEKKAGDFRKVANHIAGLAEEIGNAVFVDCFDFLPRDTALFSDAYLHPNDEGFRHYTDGLVGKLAELGRK